MKEEDKIVGESLHTISKGIHNKVQLLFFLMIVKSKLYGIKIEITTKK